MRFLSRKKRKEVMQKKKVLKDKREYAGVYVFVDLTTRVFVDLTTLRAKMLYYLKKGRKKKSKMLLVLLTVTGSYTV